MAFTLAGSNSPTIQAFVNALYGYTVGSATMTQVNADIAIYGTLRDTINAYYDAGFGTLTTKQVATSIVANVGLGTDANAIAYVTGQLNSSSASNRGNAVLSTLNAFASLTEDKTYGAAAKAWNLTVSKAVTYAQTKSTDVLTSVALKVVDDATAALATAVTTTPLAAGVDSVTGPDGGYLLVTGTASTFSPLDSIVGKGPKNVLALADTVAMDTTTAVGATVSGIQTATFTTTSTLKANTAKWTGLTDVSSSSVGTTTLTLGSSTNASAVVGTAAATVSKIDGGVNVSLTRTGGTANAAATGVNIGSTTAPTGTVTVTETGAIAAAATGGNIVVNGGTIDSISYTNSGLATNTSATLGTITLTGTATTTTVSVTSSPDALAAATTAATATAAAVTAAAGTVLGSVNISDLNATSTVLPNTITSVSVNNAGATTISSNALTTLNLSGTLTGGATAVTITNAASNPTNTTLSLGLGLTSLNLIKNNTATKPTIVDTNSEITTINAIMSSDSTLNTISDGGLKSLNLSGTGVLSLTTAPTTLTTISFADAAGINADLSSTLITAIDASKSSAKETLTLNATTQSFTGGAGQDVITISTDASQKITAGSAAGNEIILDGAGATFTTAKTMTNVTGFTTLGFGTSSSGTFALGTAATSSTTSGNITGITSLDVAAGAGTIVVTGNTATNLTLQGNATSVTITNASTTGSSDTMNITLGKTTVGAAVTVGTLALGDSAGVGIGTINIKSQNITGSLGGTGNTITTFTNGTNFGGMSTLNVTGNDALIFTGLTDNAFGTITLNNNSTDVGVAGLQTGALVTPFMSVLNLGGTNATTVGGITDTLATPLTINDTDTGAVILGTVTAANATSLTVTDSSGTMSLSPVVAAATSQTFTATGSGVITVAADTGTATKTLNLNGSVLFTGTISSTKGITVNGATDNSAVVLTLGDTGGINTDTVVLGNGVDSVISTNTHGTVNITLGSGAGDSTTTTNDGSSGSVNITVAGHSAADSFNVNSNVQTTASTLVGLTTITGAAKGDKLILTGDALASVATAPVAFPPVSTNVAANIIAAGAAAAVAHGSLTWTQGGNTYVYESLVAGGAAAVGDTVIVLTGTHTFAATNLVGQILLAS